MNIHGSNQTQFFISTPLQLRQISPELQHGPPCYLIDPKPGINFQQARTGHNKGARTVMALWTNLFFLLFFALISASHAATNSTTTTLSTYPNPSVAGNNVSFTATVEGTVPPTLLGLVTFQLDSSSFVSLNVSTNTSTATVSFITTTLPVGTHSMMATYSGDSVHATSNSPVLVLVVNPVLSSASTERANSWYHLVCRLLTFSAKLRAVSICDP
mgnify:CR=1 FL=1